jgi:hypothetical protein
MFVALRMIETKHLGVKLEFTYSHSVCAFLFALKSGNVQLSVWSPSRRMTSRQIAFIQGPYIPPSLVTRDLILHVCAE